MKTKKRLIMVLSGLIFVMSLLAVGCSGNSADSTKADERHSYTWWIPAMDGLFVNSYDKNPGVEYLMSKTWEDENGKDTKLALEFMVPAEGSQVDNLNTMIGTGDYTDIIDASMYSGSVAGLYDDGIVLDITTYVEKYMPNYLKFLDQNPQYKQTATNVVNGDVKYLQLYSYRKELGDQWGGFMYRRDWIVKYGKNPEDGSSFSGEYTVKNEDGTYNLDTWKDNVVFPSGGSDPIYISDWEWMMDIFQTAIEEQKITDGYCMSLYYPGYIATGDLASAFGGGAPSWYQTKDGMIENGLTSDDFRTYLQCMNTWYKNGWIDTAFQEHASDMFYTVDETKVHQGKVGLWYGMVAQLAGGSDLDDKLTKGMVVNAARPPINDTYGTDAQKNVEPYAFYQMGQELSPIVITSKAEKKDLVALFKFLDHQFSDEGMLIHNAGLNKEQYEATKNALYTQYGITEGAYTVSTEKNSEGLFEIEYVDFIKEHYDMETALRANRLFGLDGVPEGFIKVNHDEAEGLRHSLNEWIVYKNTGMLSSSLQSQLSAEDAGVISKISMNVTEFAAKNVPSFITGKKDPFNDQDWQDFLKAMNKYNPDKVTQIYQNLLEQLKK